MEKTTSFTPGPWTLGTRAVYQDKNDPVFWHRDVVNGSKTIRIAVVSGVGEDRTEANARLIAVAPELLEQLKSAREMIASSMEKDDPLWFTQQEAGLLDPIDEVIAKAEGKE